MKAQLITAAIVVGVLITLGVTGSAGDVGYTVGLAVGYALPYALIGVAVLALTLTIVWLVRNLRS